MKLFKFDLVSLLKDALIDDFACASGMGYDRAELYAAWYLESLQEEVKRLKNIKQKLEEEMLFGY